MKSYRELAEKIFERRDKYLVARKRKRKKIIKRASASLCALIVVLGISALHLGWFGEVTVHTLWGDLYGGDNGNISDYEVSLTETTTKPRPSKRPLLTLPPMPETPTRTTNTTTSSTSVVIKQTSQWKPVNPIKTLSGHKYTIATQGKAIDWVEENDILHILFSKPDRYMQINTATGVVIKDVALGDAPAEIHLYGDELWVSYPKLKAVKIYSKNSFDIVRELAFEHEIRSFDVSGDYIVYHDGISWSEVYKYNMKTNEYQAVVMERNDRYLKADILIDPNAELLYIGENGSSGSRLYCFDFNTLKLKSVFLSHVSSNVHKMSLDNGSIYWSNKRLKAADVSKAVCTYDVSREVFYADSEYVVTDAGIYNQKNAQQIIKADSKYNFSMALINSSGDLVVGGKGCIYVVAKPFTGATTTTTTTTITIVQQGETTTQKISDMYSYNVDMVMDYFVEGDILHVVTRTPNLYMVIDTNTGLVLRVESLPAQPVYMKRIDGKIWISYGSLKSIIVYDEKTFEIENQFTFDAEIFDMFPVVSFEVYGDYLFIAEEDFGVYRYNMKTQELVGIKGVYCQADIAIDRKTGLVYIGDSGHSGGKLYCVDAETLEVKSKYVADGYGIDNHCRKVFVRDDGVYWGIYKFALNDVSQILMTYRAPEYHGIGMHYVTDRYVVDTAGFFDRVTGELIWEKEMKNYDNHAAVTDSGNVMWSENGVFFIMTNRL